MHLWRFNLHKTNAANEELVISLNCGREVQESIRYTYCSIHFNSLCIKMDISLLAVRDINHKYIVVESEIDSEWLVASGLQAFLEDPTSEEPIYLLVRLLGENRMNPKTGIILYAKEYGFWNTYIDQRIDEVAEECSSDINDFVKLSELPNENAEAVSKIIDSFS